VAAGTDYTLVNQCQDDYWFVVEYTEESILKNIVPFSLKDKKQKSSSNIEAIFFI
jgi:hypothetical protein